MVHPARLPSCPSLVLGCEEPYAAPFLGPFSVFVESLLRRAGGPGGWAADRQRRLCHRHCSPLGCCRPETFLMWASCAAADVPVDLPGDLPLKVSHSAISHSPKA